MQQQQPPVGSVQPSSVDKGTGRGGAALPNTSGASTLQVQVEAAAGASWGTGTYLGAGSSGTTTGTTAGRLDAFRAVQGDLEGLDSALLSEVLNAPTQMEWARSVVDLVACSVQTVGTSHADDQRAELCAALVRVQPAACAHVFRPGNTRWACHHMGG